jgi:hypothetical protein
LLLAVEFLPLFFPDEGTCRRRHVGAVQHREPLLQRRADRPGRTRDQPLLRS